MRYDPTMQAYEDYINNWLEQEAKADAIKDMTAEYGEVIDDQLFAPQ